jgi:hypothetical protein
MAYLNCALCPSQTYLYGHHHYKNGDAYAEYRCLSKHKTFIEETHGDDQRNSTDARSSS